MEAEANFAVGAMTEPPPRADGAERCRCACCKRDVEWKDALRVGGDGWLCEACWRDVTGDFQVKA
ncbi:hypothetical protein LCGC14_3115940 [marine sediment metagenome]|uniref:Uncharacterized protein n=1 Tax=marine sediment metagenome TaxID=412755 RepID=A0A0F8WSL8_9ZZZZ